MNKIHDIKEASTPRVGPAVEATDKVMEALPLAISALRAAHLRKEAEAYQKALDIIDGFNRERLDQYRTGREPEL